MIYKYLYILGLILTSNNIHASQESTQSCDYKQNGGVLILDSSKVRFDNREECFSKEHAIIKKFRSSHSSVKKQSDSPLRQIVGLGLSGGGVKSSAFQLGLLSGLHFSQNKNNAPLLNEIDYISSVSGGSWANGAYISALESDDDLFSCLSEIATAKKISSACMVFEGILSNYQNQIKGSGDWQKQIIDNYLRGGDITLKSIQDQLYNKPGRPFPIFLSTHSNTIIGKKDPKNFPFEFTPISISAIADCNTPETPCGFLRRYLRPLHWNNPPEKGFSIDLSKENGISTVVEKYDLYEATDELQISHPMWASGGLVAKVFSLHLHLNKNNKKIPGVRKKYVLSDGGKADNVGLIPLVERGADLIILSQIASDSKLKFGDLKRSSVQVDRLFGLTVDTDSLIRPHSRNAPPIISEACIKDGENNVSSIFLIKPTTKNIVGFYSYLQSSKYSGLLKALKDDMHSNDPVRFPQNDTIELKYPQMLIYSYFALGEYIGQTELSQKLNNWLTSGSQCTKLVEG